MNSKRNFFSRGDFCHIRTIKEEAPAGIDQRIGIVKQSTNNAGVVLKDRVARIAIPHGLVGSERHGNRILVGKPGCDVCLYTFVGCTESCWIGQQVSILA